MARIFALLGVLAVTASVSAFAYNGLEQITRYGKLSIDEESALLFNGKIVEPRIQGNNGLSFEEIFKIGNTDVVLIQNIGGTACPALFTLVTVSISGLSQTPDFGTCSDLAESTTNGKSITITMPKIRGKGMAKYVFTGGKLTENGKPVNSQK